jgi:hypothetical protein
VSFLDPPSVPVPPYELHDNVQKDWANIDNRILGHVRFSPPIKLSAGPHKYIQDYALVEIEPSKIDAAPTPTRCRRYAVHHLQLLITHSLS